MEGTGGVFVMRQGMEEDSREETNWEGEKER